MDTQYNYQQLLRSCLMETLRQGLQGGTHYYFHMEGSDICHVFKDYENKWFRVRLVPKFNVYTMHVDGYTMTVWGRTPEALDPSETREAKEIGRTTGFYGVEKNDEVLRLARKYFLKCE